GLQYSESFGDVVADKLGIVARLRFFDAIGDHRRRIWLGHTYLSIAVGSYSTRMLHRRSGLDRPPTDPTSTSADLGKPATCGACGKGSGTDGGRAVTPE